MSTSPSRSSRRPSSSSRKPWLVVPSSITTIVSAIARRRRAIASSRVRPCAMILAIIESNSAGTRSPSANPLSTRIPGPPGRRSRVILPGVGANPRPGSSAFRRASIACPLGGGGSPSSLPAGGDVELELDQVDAGHHLGHGVLDLKPRVDLHEREPALGGLVQELDGGGAAVAGELGQPGRRLGQIALLLGGQHRAGRLLDDLLMPALIAAVAHAQRPHGALAVGDQLDFDVASGSDQALHQHARVAERLLGLLAGALERVLELVGALNPAHPATAAARGGLDHHREPELLAVADGVLDGLDRLAAPGRHRHIGLLGQALALDLVAERPHHVGVGSNEHDPESLAQLRELGVLGDEPPADPCSVGTGLVQRPLERS